MRTRHASVLLAAVLLAGCGGGSQAVMPAAPGEAIQEAKVPIADVAEEAQEVNDVEDPSDLDQASGIVMRSDKGRGLDEDDVTDTALAGGCVPGYGEDGACLPPVPPRLAAEHAGHAGMLGEEMAAFYTCEDVRELIPDGIAVQTEDTLGLDSNEDGIACGKGDQ